MHVVGEGGNNNNKISSETKCVISFSNRLSTLDRTTIKGKWDVEGSHHHHHHHSATDDVVIVVVRTRCHRESKRIYKPTHTTVTITGTTTITVVSSTNTTTITTTTTGIYHINNHK